jgi:hypothetical protein
MLVTLGDVTLMTVGAMAFAGGLYVLGSAAYSTWGVLELSRQSSTWRMIWGSANGHEATSSMRIESGLLKS